MTSFEHILSIRQVGELFVCDVIASYDGVTESMANIRCDKVNITYNRMHNMFKADLVFDKMSLINAQVARVEIHDLDINGKTRMKLPSYDAEWPYDRITLEMKE